MGTTTTNLGLYKPTVGESGWGEEVNTNFDTLDARLYSSHPGIQWVTSRAGVGDDASDGKTPATAKRTILAAYDALPTAGGTIFVIDEDFTEAYVDISASRHGLYMAGANDSQYNAGALTPALIAAGWRVAKTSLRIVGVAASSHTGANARAPQVMLKGGSQTGDRAKPALWLSGGGQVSIENLNFATDNAVCLKLGIDSTGTTTSNTSGVTFTNCSFGVGNTAGYGPAIELGYAFWLDFHGCTLSGNRTAHTLSAASISAGTTARFTDSIDHGLKAGDTVYVTGFTDASYNSTAQSDKVWTVSNIHSSTQFDCDIGTSPSAAVINGNERMRPIRSYRRAAVAMDRSDYYTSGIGAGLITFRDTVFNTGGVHWFPKTGTANGNLTIENVTYEGDFGVTPDPPVLHLRVASGSSSLPAATEAIYVKNVELADSASYDGAVRVDGVNTPPIMTSAHNASVTGNAVTTGHNYLQTRAQPGWYSRYSMHLSEGITRAGRDVVLSGVHDAGRRLFSPVSVRFANQASDPTSWSSTTGTLTTGTTAPDGSANAATLTHTSAGVSTMASFSETPAAGDWLIFGVWHRLISGATSSDSNYATVGVGTGCLLDLDGSTTTIYLKAPGGVSDGGWEWFANGGKYETVTGGAVTITFKANCAANANVGYYAPVIFRVPAASAVDDAEMKELIRHLAPYPSTAPAGAMTTQRGQKLIAWGGLGVGNSASATTPGSVVKKMEVFDQTGASLGYVPIYSSIT